MSGILDCVLRGAGYGVDDRSIETRNSSPVTRTPIKDTRNPDIYDPVLYHVVFMQNAALLAFIHIIQRKPKHQFQQIGLVINRCPG